MVAITESLRAVNCPPRKKRRLSNGFSQLQQQEEKSSDKENNCNSRNINKNPRKRPRCVLSQKSQASTSNNNKRRSQNKHNRNEKVYKFGDIRLKQAIEIPAGAIVRLELINFLCHSNFSIAFHPFVNVIFGQNGS